MPIGPKFPCICQSAQKDKKEDVLGPDFNFDFELDFEFNFECDFEFDFELKRAGIVK